MIDLTDDNEYVEYDKKHGVMTKNSTLLNAGNGLFATKAFKKDEIIIPYDGEKLTLEKKQTRYPNDDAKYLVQLGSNTVIDAVDVSKSNLGRYANHKSLTRANAKLTRF